jgi:hypothetical protein
MIHCEVKMARAAIEIYPEVNDRDFFCPPGDYYPMLESFGNIVLQVDDDYQGDSRVLYQDGENFGYLVFGWGSCSGCDALQGCNSIKDLDNLIEGMESGIQWKSRLEMEEYFKTRDWDNDYHGRSEETKKFVAKALEILATK